MHKFIVFRVIWFLWTCAKNINVVTFIVFLIPDKNWILWYMERLCVSSYTVVTDLQGYKLLKADRFLAHPVFSVRSCQTWIQDLLLQDQDQDQDSEVPRPRPRPRLWGSRPRPRPRLWGSRPRPRLSSFKTKTETQDLQDQYWKSMTEMNCDKQKDWKVMAGRKSSILVVAHSKQQDMFNKTISAVTVNHCSVSNFC